MCYNTCVSVYYVVLIWVSFYILNHPVYKNIKDTELCELLLIRNAVGGFPIIYLHNMFVRAELDLLSPFIGLVILQSNMMLSSSI